MPQIILASTSPYRQALLKKLGLAFEVMAPGIPEFAVPAEPSEALARRLAEEKAAAVASRVPDSLVIGSDQVAVLDNVRLSKPMDRESAIGQLRQASGRTVSFYTAVCVMDSNSGVARTELDCCRVDFRRLSDGEIERYVDRDRPFDCAGGFKSESLGIALFERISGEDPNALIGLPLIRLVRLLAGFGIDVL